MPDRAWVWVARRGSRDLRQVDCRCAAVVLKVCAGSTQVDWCALIWMSVVLLAVRDKVSVELGKLKDIVARPRGSESAL